jgi:uncharacterized protein YdhG (YjbR/CyaY superfamily)
MAMVDKRAATVKEYLAWLPEDRRKVISKVRSVIRKHLPKGYEEKVTYGVISYQVPLKTLPDTYNGQPLCYAALAAQKNHNALYLMAAYGDAKQRAELEQAFKTAGKKLDMGKACVRFKSADDLPLPAIGKLIAAVPPAKYIATYEASRKRK